MRFAQPYMLLWLWIVVPIGFFLFWTRFRKTWLLSRFVEKKLLADLAGGVRESRVTQKHVLIIAFFVFCILSLARPQWGYEWHPIKQEGIDILLAIDTSKSMLTQDVRPNRLERTKLAVKDLLRKLSGDRLGLIAFAGDAFLVCPLTIDYSGFLLSLEDLDSNTIPRGGTNIGRAIEEAIRIYEKTTAKDRALIILTDGENVEGEPLSAARKAKEKGIRVFCVGIGTKEGDLIQVTSAQGTKEFLKDENGNFVKSRLNEKLLQDIALATGGAYVRASGAEFGLDLIYERELSKMSKTERESKMEKKYFERFQIPLVFALFALVAEALISTRRKTAA